MAFHKSSLIENKALLCTKWIRVMLHEICKGNFFTKDIIFGMAIGIDFRSQLYLNYFDVFIFLVFKDQLYWLFKLGSVALVPVFTSSKFSSVRQSSWKTCSFSQNILVKLQEGNVFSPVCLWPHMDMFKLVHLGIPPTCRSWYLAHRPVQTYSLGKAGDWPLTERPSYLCCTLKKYSSCLIPQ